MSQSPIKVLIVEDSPVALGVYKKLLNEAPEVEVVGTASNGLEALNLIPQVKPQVMCTDLHMPGMDGLELIKQVMAKYPLPIMVLSNAVQKDDIDNVYEVLQAGALEVVPKTQSDTPTSSEELKRKLVLKLKVLASKKVAAKSL